MRQELYSWYYYSSSCFSSLHTSAFGRLGPGAAGSALCTCIANKYIWRQALVRHLDAVESGVSSDVLVIKYHPKLWDWSEITVHSYERRERMR